MFPHIRSLNPRPAEVVVDRSTPMAQARKNVIERATQPYCLVLDADTIIPNEFLVQAQQKLIEGYMACTLNYLPDVQGHPPFGASFWATTKLKELYDYHVYLQNYTPICEKTEDNKGNTAFTIKNPYICECRYIWAKLKPSELYVSEDLKAKHYKQIPFKA